MWFLALLLTFRGLLLAGHLEDVSCPNTPKLIKKTKLSNFTIAPLAASPAVSKR